MSASSFALARECGVGEKKTNQNHDDMQEHLEVERALENERTMTMLLNTKLCELVDVILKKQEALRCGSWEKPKREYSPRPERLLMSPPMRQYVSVLAIVSITTDRVLVQAVSGVVTVCVRITL
jgi:hypothetical protein